METNESIELNRIIDILISKKIIIAVILIVFTIIGFIYTYNYTTPKYKSTSTLLLMSNAGEKTISASDLTLNSELISTYSNIVKNPKVLKQVIENLDLKITEEQLLSQIQVKVIEDTYIIEIAVEDEIAQKAMAMTKELANVCLKEIKQIYNLDNIGIIDEAELATSPYNINHIKDIMISFVIGVIIAGFYVIMIYTFDNSIKREEEIEKYLKLKSLGVVPIYANKRKEIVSTNKAKSFITECINTIRTNILYMNSTKRGKTVLITSCRPREGKSWISSNVAVAFAQTNKKVLLIDADMRKGRVNRIFNVSNQEGLSNYLYFMTGNVREDLELAKQYIKETDISNLHILTNGTIPPNPSELIDSDNMKELIKILKSVYDIIIIDAPPCKLVTDGVILSTMVDSTVLVVDAEKNKLVELREIKKSIQAVGGRIIGIVLNKATTKEKTYGTNYYNDSKMKKEPEKVLGTKIVTVEELITEALQKLNEKEEQKEEIKLIESVEYKDEDLNDIVVYLKNIQENYEKAINIINKKSKINK